MNQAKFARKPSNLKAVAAADEYVPYEIVKTVELTAAQYGHLGGNLFQAVAPFIGDFQGGTNTKGEYRVVRVIAENRRALLINPSGFSYARYVAYETDHPGFGKTARNV